MTRRSIIKILITIIIISILCTCVGDTSDVGKITRNRFAISFLESNSLDEIEKLLSKLENFYPDGIQIEKVRENKYRLILGGFTTSFEAGKAAYELFADSIISSYSITYNNKKVYDGFANVLFLGYYLGRPSVYSYNLVTKQKTLEWSRWGKKVFTLNPNENNISAFITTTGGIYKKGSFPLLRDVQIYQLKFNDDQTIELEKLGDGAQLYTYWNKNNLFGVNFTKLDTLNPRKIEQIIYSFDKNGLSKPVEKRRYDLLKDGFPFPAEKIPLFNSPGGRFRLRLVSSNNLIDIYLKDFEERSEQLIISTSNRIKDVRWSNNQNFAFVVTEKIDNKRKAGKPAADELIILNAISKKTTKIFSGYRFENLLVHGKLLFFDERLDNIAQIAVYDYVKDKFITTVTNYGGCGLNNLPL